MLIVYVSQFIRPNTRNIYKILQKKKKELKKKNTKIIPKRKEND